MIDRYASAQLLAFGTQYGTQYAVQRIRYALQNNLIPYITTTLLGFQRLDNIAGEAYGDGRLWWVIAAASNIGWGLQIPPGTTINIPDLTAVSKLV